MSTQHRLTSKATMVATPAVNCGPASLQQASPYTRPSMKDFPEESAALITPSFPCYAQHLTCR